MAAYRSHTHGGSALQIKLLMIGDSGVGKTCLLLRYAKDSFAPTYITTIGIDFKIKDLRVKLKSGVEKDVKMQIWDTAGQERFRTITTSYFRGAQGIILIYDVTDRKSFDSITTWVSQLEEHADKNVNKVLVANKVDLPDRRVVSEEEGKALAAEFGIKFFETSARTSANVNEAFQSIAVDVVERLSSAGTGGGRGGRNNRGAERGNATERVNLGQQSQNKGKKGCC